MHLEKIPIDWENNFCCFSACWMIFSRQSLCLYDFTGKRERHNRGTILEGSRHWEADLSKVGSVPNCVSQLKDWRQNTEVAESWANCAGTRWSWSFLSMSQQVYCHRLSCLGIESRLKTLLKVGTWIRTMRTFCHISCRSPHFHTGKKKIALFVDQKATPTTPLQVCTVISMSGRAKGGASKMGNKVELAHDVLSTSLILQALCKPRASSSLISQWIRSSPKRKYLPSPCNSN